MQIRHYRIRAKVHRILYQADGIKGKHAKRNQENNVSFGRLTKGVENAEQQTYKIHERPQRATLRALQSHRRRGEVHQENHHRHGRLALTAKGMIIL